MSQHEKEKIFEIEIDTEDSVLDVKEKIRKELKLPDILDIQLIWNDESES